MYFLLISGSLLMLNLLIAMMNNTYNDYHKSKREFLIMEKYNIIMYYEGRQSKKQRQKLRNQISERSKIPITKKVPGEKEIFKEHGTFNIIKHSTEWWQKGDQQAEKENPRLHKLALLIICPQNDFLDSWMEFSKPEDGSKPKPLTIPVLDGKGALSVHGSKGDYQRVAKMIDIYGHHIQDISVAMDAHLEGNISLASSWVMDEKLKQKFLKQKCLVVTEELLCPKDDPQNPLLYPKEDVGYGLEWAKYYVRALKVADKVQLKLWPDHCIVKKNVQTMKYEAVKKENSGTRDYFGYDVVEDIKFSLDNWTKMKFQKQKGKKGESHVANGPAVSYRETYREYRNIGLSRKTESYSAVLPEVFPALAVNGKRFDPGI